MKTRGISLLSVLAPLLASQAGPQVGNYRQTDVAKDEVREARRLCRERGEREGRFSAATNDNCFGREAGGVDRLDQMAK